MARPEVPTLKTPSVKTLHHAEYPAISPLRPELSKAGKTVLIAGGSTGIGFAIARAFVRAKAARVILLGRREAVVKESAAKLAAEVGDKTTSTTTTIIPLVCDVVDLAESAKLWDSLKKDGIFVDVLVLNAATFGEPKPILEAGLASVWGAFEVNVRMPLDFAERFHKQQVGGGRGGRQKFLVNVSTAAIHTSDVDVSFAGTYGLTKNAGTLLLQHVAAGTDPTDMQIVSFHPGGILTEMAKAVGFVEEAFEWDDDTLPGGFAVWAASEEARFAHGRMLAAHWDVDELKNGEAGKQIESRSSFLRIGVIGAL